MATVFEGFGENPLFAHKLSYLRQSPSHLGFREYEALIHELGVMLGYEASSLSLTTEDIRIGHGDRRPGVRVRRKPILVPVVRQGLTLADGVRSIVPTPYMGHIGIHETPKDKNPRPYMVVLPDDIDDRACFLIDMFVVRGRTSIVAMRQLIRHGILPKNIYLLVLVADKAGLENIFSEALLNEINVVCVKIDNDENDLWMPHFNNTNSRLYRTTDRPEQLYKE